MALIQRKPSISKQSSQVVVGKPCIFYKYCLVCVLNLFNSVHILHSYDRYITKQQCLEVALTFVIYTKARFMYVKHFQSKLEILGTCKVS